MFTGLVQSIGVIERSPQGVRLRWTAPPAGAAEAGWLPADLALGDSVAVDGVCLTVAERLGAGLAAPAGGLVVELPEADGLAAAGVAVVCTVCAALPVVTTAARRNSERPSWTVTLTRRALIVVAKAALLPPVPPVPPAAEPPLPPVPPLEVPVAP